MTAFEPILKAAEARTGGAAALQARLPTAKSAAELRALGDDRYLSLMSLRIFRAGLKHAMVDARWPAFEEAFQGFEPRRLRMLSDEDLDALLTDRRLIPKVVDIDPFHRGDFCRQSGARCAAVRAPQATRDAAGDKKRPALAGGAHRPAGCVAALTRCPASRRAPRLPGEPIGHHERGQYQ